MFQGLVFSSWTRLHEIKEAVRIGLNKQLQHNNLTLLLSFSVCYYFVYRNCWVLQNSVFCIPLFQCTSLIIFSLLYIGVRKTSLAIFNNYSMSARWIWYGKPTPISYPTSANGIIVLLNSVSFVHLEFIKFYWLLILQNDRKLMWQKQQQVGSPMACAPFLNLVE